jgi:hypothetical protein
MNQLIEKPYSTEDVIRLQARKIHRLQLENDQLAQDKAAYRSAFITLALFFAVVATICFIGSAA